MNIDIDKVLFWERVNNLIKSQKTKQEAIAAQCNTPYKTFKGWVTRKTFPEADKTYLIAQALGTTVEYLISGKDPKLLTADELLEEIRFTIDRYQKKSSKKKPAQS